MLFRSGLFSFVGLYLKGGDYMFGTSIEEVMSLIGEALSLVIMFLLLAIAVM